MQQSTPNLTRGAAHFDHCVIGRRCTLDIRRAESLGPADCRALTLSTLHLWALDPAPTLENAPAPQERRETIDFLELQLKGGHAGGSIGGLFGSTFIVTA